MEQTTMRESLEKLVAAFITDLAHANRPQHTR